MAIQFINETDAHMWRRHVNSVFAAQWEKEFDAKKTAKVG